MPESVFIETTIPSYLVANRSRDIVQAARQELTIEWWSRHRHRYQLVTSQVVLDEAARGESGMADKRLGSLAGIPILDIDEAVTALAKDLIAAGVIPERVPDDALHIACASVHEVDFLLTWNCRHIANPHNHRRIHLTLAERGLDMPVICTPEELIEDES